jgi:hypothetical protein
MATHSLHRHDPYHISRLDWVLVLAGALFAWLFWPPMHS